MDSSKNKRGAGYGRSHYGSTYGYGSYNSYTGYSGYGYGYGSGSGGTAVERTFQDYLLILRERVWYIVIAFLMVSAAVTVFTFTETPIFRSVATVEIFRRNPMVMQVQQVMDSEIRTAEDLNTQVNILRSDTIVQRVSDRLTGDDLRRFLAPYMLKGHPAPNPSVILAKNRNIVPERLSLIIDIEYLHPDREIASKVANLFAAEYIAYNEHILAEESIKAVDELELRANEQKTKVDDIAGALQAYREKYNLVSLDQRKDINTEKLRELSGNVTRDGTAFQEAQTRWKQVTAAEQKNEDPLDLPFIASVPAVSQLQTQVATLKITVAQLSQRYRAKHPQMSQAVDSLNEAENQLRQAIKTTIAQIETEYQNALQNYQQAQAALAAQESASLKLDRYGLDYSNLERDYEVNEKLLEQVLQRMKETSMSSTVESQNARSVDRAVPGIRPVSPNYRLNLSLGFVGGIGLGLALAFFAAYTDDRVKSAFDIESVVGLSLIGIIPEVKRMRSVEEMEQTVAARGDQEVTEAFATLFSALQLKDESKSAQCILVTSTVASEGKSFITTNLAQTYASHGERVVVVDCDLRRPAVNRVFHLENLKGVIDICTSDLLLDEAIVKNVRPNLDVLPTGGRSKNPTQTLSGKNFAIMISELRKRYDRVFIDTPPIAIVSDALIILPLVDGSLYSIYFNKVRRKTAQHCAQRLNESNVANFGAVLNGLTGGLGGYYYSHYYDKSYKGYYVTKAENTNGAGPKITENLAKHKRG